MADTGTVTVSFKPSFGRIKRIDFDWTCDASGDAEKFVNTELRGEITALITDPDDTSVPTALYDLTIEDDKSIDILNALGVDRSATVIEQAAIFLATGLLPRPVSTTSFTFKVANAGVSKKGLAQLYYIASNF